MILFPLFAAGVVDNGGKLPPVQQPVANFAAGVVATGGKLPPPGGKFVAGVVDTGGAPSFGNISANFRKNLNLP